MQNRKGFTLIEVVVALAVLSIISVAVIGTITSVNSLTNRYNDKLLLGYSLENVAETFFNTTTKEAFVEDLEFCFGDDTVIASDDDLYLYYLNGSAVPNQEDCRYIVKINWTASILTIAATDKKNNVVIAEREYSKV